MEQISSHPIPHWHSANSATQKHVQCVRLVVSELNKNVHSFVFSATQAADVKPTIKRSSKQIMYACSNTYMYITRSRKLAPNSKSSIETMEYELSMGITHSVLWCMYHIQLCSCLMPRRPDSMCWISQNLYALLRANRLNKGG